jgi:NAD-dependent DNA ligase
MKSKAEIIKNLFDVGITIKEPEKVKIDSNKLAGKSFCFTGKINSINPATKKNYTREDMQALVIANGGLVEDSVKKGLTYLVQADPSSTSGKTQKAQQFGTSILSEDNFFNMVK